MTGLNVEPVCGVDLSLDVGPAPSAWSVESASALDRKGLKDGAKLWNRLDLCFSKCGSIALIWELIRNSEPWAFSVPGSTEEMVRRPLLKEMPRAMSSLGPQNPTFNPCVALQDDPRLFQGNTSLSSCYIHSDFLIHHTSNCARGTC